MICEVDVDRFFVDFIFKRYNNKIKYINKVFKIFNDFNLFSNILMYKLLGKLKMIGLRVVYYNDLS